MNQPLLFRHRWHQRLQDRIVSRLLWMANSSPPTVARYEFYQLKDRLCRRYGRLVGHDWQRIIKKCWRCNGTGADPYGRHDDSCGKCGGTGEFARLHVQLERWEFAGRTFHRPVHRQWKRPDAPITIDGYVEHAKLGAASREAVLWLALMFDRRLLWQLMTDCGYAGWVSWRYPLTNAQHITRAVAMFARRFRLRRCYCGRTWRQWWGDGGWCVCRRCRKPGGMEVPF